jgi:hypothetical protein
LKIISGYLQLVEVVEVLFNSVLMWMLSQLVEGVVVEVVVVL